MDASCRRDRGDGSSWAAPAHFGLTSLQFEATAFLPDGRSVVEISECPQAKLCDPLNVYEYKILEEPSDTLSAGDPTSSGTGLVVDVALAVFSVLVAQWRG